MAVTTKIERKRFDQPDETREFTEGKGKIDIVSIGGHDVGRGRFEPGWRWSANVKPIAKTESCQSDHLGVVLEGRMTVRMENGDEIEYGPGDVFHMPPGHDAWIVGDEPCVLVDFTGVSRYAKPA
jgi:mannose-6-phosphate isomerase-like protein (cupin superfamily)